MAVKTTNIFTNPYHVEKEINKNEKDKYLFFLKTYRSILNSKPNKNIYIIFGIADHKNNRKKGDAMKKFKYWRYSWNKIYL